MASSLVKRYTDYRIKNEQIKMRQRRERERELRPYLEDVGRAVEEDRTNGHSVPELAGLISNKNRNFLYAALRAYKDSLPKQEELDIPSEPEFEPEPVYSIDYYSTNTYAVCTAESWDRGGQIWYHFRLDDGVVIGYDEAIADRWGKPFLKKLIAEVESAAAEN